MDYVNKIFELLGVQPKEEFYLIGKPAENDINYYLDSSLNVYGWYDDGKAYKSNISIQDILINKVKIIKNKKPSKAEQIAIEYAKACGCKWMAKDQNGDIYAYKHKPEKLEDMWKDEISKFYLKIEISMSFLSWMDTEPILYRVLKV